MAAAARAPLFDRLVSFEDRARGGLKESVRRELEQLLNTRSSLPATEWERRELTVVDYGLPDLSAISLGDPAEHGRLARMVARAVAAFEPRLAEVKVEVAEVRLRERAMAFALSGWLVHDTWREPVTFPTVLGLGSSQAVVEGDREE